MSERDLAATSKERNAARSSVAPEVVSAIRQAIRRSIEFNRVALRNTPDWEFEIAPGLTVGERSTAIPSAGLFVPSGKGSFPSVLVQLGAPAVAAGVPEITVVVPPVAGSRGIIDPAVLIAAEELGISRVVRANGHAGVAGLAFGTATIPKVEKVLGPGSPAVALAQLEVQRYGVVGHSLLGPSEMLVLADASADPTILAADLLSEAEHGNDSASVLVTAVPSLIDEVDASVGERILSLPEPRQTFARSSLGRWGGAVLVDDLEQGIDVSNLYAAEHVQLAVKHPRAVLERITYAGEVLLGQETPNVAANYLIGIPAALPTSRYARVNSGVTAHTFRRRTTTAHTTPAALQELAVAIRAFADHEGFPAHRAALDARIKPD